MDTREIEYILKNEKGFRGVFAMDQLPMESERPALLVCNTHESCLPGEHWVAVYLPVQGPSEFFDTFGRRPFTEELRRLLGYPYMYNKDIVQDLKSAVCGFHVVHYAKLRLRDVPFQHILDRYRRDLKWNDAYVVQEVKRYIAR